MSFRVGVRRPTRTPAETMRSPRAHLSRSARVLSRAPRRSWHLRFLPWLPRRRRACPSAGLDELRAAKTIGVASARREGETTNRGTVLVVPTGRGAAASHTVALRPSRLVLGSESSPSIESSLAATTLTRVESRSSAAARRVILSKSARTLVHESTHVRPQFIRHVELDRRVLAGETHRGSPASSPSQREHLQLIGLRESFLHEPHP